MKRSLRTITFACALVGAALGGAAKSDASDHIDGIKTAIDNAADITDVFAFTSPKDPNKLVVAMNVHTLAFSQSSFSNAVDYKIRIRPITDARNLKASTNDADELGVSCTFSGGIPVIDPTQRASCTFALASGKQTVNFETRGGDFRSGGQGWGNGVRVFAGVRSDPWFLDLGKTIKWNSGAPVVKEVPGSNGLWGQNVLSIVAEIDKSKLPGPMLAVNGQTVRK
ncbi:MAG TPA: DUF4331 family protein [Labilithrix sp.]|jgi:hypothetical protein